MKIKNYRCRCGNDDFFLADEKNQTGIYCTNCGKWFKWANKDEKNLMKNCPSQKGNDEIDPNDDLIKRHDAIEAVTKYCTAHDLRDLLADLEVLPTERKTGKWIEHED